MFYRKRLLIISTILILLLSIVPHNLAQALDDIAGVKVDAFYTSLNENQTIQSGETAIYRLDFYASGIDGTSTEPVGLEIKLPENENGKTSLASELEDLKIADQVPVYDETTNSLKYTFDQLTAGQSYSVTLRVNTQNGIIPNGMALKTEAIFTQGDREIVRKAAQVSVTSDTQVALSKTYAYTVGYENDADHVPKVGETIVWKGKVEVPKDEFGLAFIKEGSQIVVSDTIQSGLTYVGASGEGASVRRNGSTVSLSFAAPSLVEQLAAQADPNRSNLFEKEVEIRTRANNFQGQLSNVKNKLSTSFTNISDKTIQAESNEATFTLGKGSNPSQISPNGRVLVGVNLGPKDGDGMLAGAFINNGTISGYNPTPTVPDTATLAFKMIWRAGYRGQMTRLAVMK
ncbi:hypothetical protein [Streptococcus marmotae]|uniref:hypothetical protein n=1 Tax=Streptococcus marmotae TaxID=1825069 RepID=UPI000831811A|nr:hypothetical protein [Streptococcus marmotae]